MILGDLKRRAYSRAKQLSRASVGIQCLLFVGALSASFGAGTMAWLLGLVAFVAPIVNFVLKDRSRYHYGIGERARRIQLLQDGLGRAPSAAELLDLHDIAPDIKASEPPPIKSEFTSNLPVGAARLAHITQEAAYYTRSAARNASYFFLTVTGIGVLGTFVLLWLLLMFPVADIGGEPVTAQNWARASATLLVFFATGSFAEMWRSFDGLARTAGETFGKCEGYRKGGAELLDVMLVVSTYDVALGRAPAIPTFIYKRGREKLHASWTKLMTPTAEAATSSESQLAKS